MDIARWIALVIAVLGLALFFSDLIINIKKRQNTKLNILGTVFISLSLICFILTQFVFKDQLPSVLQLIWIPFMVGYLVCDIIVAVCIGKENARKKAEAKSEATLQATEAVQTDVTDKTDTQ